MSSVKKKYKNQTDCRADTTAKGFIWANISTSTTSLLQDQSYRSVSPAISLVYLHVK